MLQSIFDRIYKNNLWSSSETVSGGGSERARTLEIREKLPWLMEEYGLQTLLDAGCGDWNWMSLIDFTGADPGFQPFGPKKIYACDIVPDLIAANRRKYVDRAVFFEADLTADALPEVDVAMCRTVLFHMSLAHVHMALANMRKTSKYLLLTTHPHVTENIDINDGDWRRLNMTLPPFLMPEPLFQFPDGPGEDGYLALWRIDE